MVIANRHMYTLSLAFACQLCGFLPVRALETRCFLNPSERVNLDRQLFLELKIA